MPKDSAKTHQHKFYQHQFTTTNDDSTNTISFNYEINSDNINSINTNNNNYNYNNLSDVSLLEKTRNIVLASSNALIASEQFILNNVNKFKSSINTSINDTRENTKSNSHSIHSYFNSSSGPTSMEINSNNNDNNNNKINHISEGSNRTNKHRSIFTPNIIFPLSNHSASVNSSSTTPVSDSDISSNISSILSSSFFSNSSQYFSSKNLEAKTQFKKITNAFYTNAFNKVGIDTLDGNNETELQENEKVFKSDVKNKLKSERLEIINSDLFEEKNSMSSTRLAVMSNSQHQKQHLFHKSAHLNPSAESYLCNKKNKFCFEANRLSFYEDDDGYTQLNQYKLKDEIGKGSYGLKITI